MPRAHDIPTDGPPYLCLDANQPDFVPSEPPPYLFLTDDLDATLAHLRAAEAGGVSPSRTSAASAS